MRELQQTATRAEEVGPSRFETQQQTVASHATPTRVFERVNGCLVAGQAKGHYCYVPAEPRL